MVTRKGDRKGTSGYQKYWSRYLGVSYTVFLLCENKNKHIHTIHILHWFSIVYQIISKLSNLQSRIVVNNLLQSTFPINVVPLIFHVPYVIPLDPAIWPLTPQLSSVRNLEANYFIKNTRIEKN